MIYQIHKREADSDKYTLAWGCNHIHIANSKLERMKARGEDVILAVRKRVSHEQLEILSA